MVEQSAERRGRGRPRKKQQQLPSLYQVEAGIANPQSPVNNIEQTRLQNASSETLSVVEVDQNAFELIDKLKDALLKSEEFKTGSADLFFDKPGEEEHKREYDNEGQRYMRFAELKMSNYMRFVDFEIRNASYNVAYEFSTDSQRLYVERLYALEGDLHRVHFIVLQSRRFKDRKPYSRPEITYCDYNSGVDKNGKRILRFPQPHEYIENTSLAAEKAREMLAGLSPQK